MEAVILAQEISTSGVNSWIEDNIITIILIIGAAVALFNGARGNIPKVITVGAGIILGLIILGLATGNTADGIAQWLIGLFTG